MRTIQAVLAMTRRCRHRRTAVRFPDVVCRDVSVLLLALIMPSSLQSGPVQVSATQGNNVAQPTPFRFAQLECDSQPEERGHYHQTGPARPLLLPGIVCDHQ